MSKKNRSGFTIDNIYGKIEEMLYRNQLVPGQKIVYGDIAKILNTSLTPIIQTLKRLESSGTVKYIPNKGYFVADVSCAEIQELYEVREALELYILPNILKNSTPSIIESLRINFREHSISDPMALGIHDAQFHLSIIKLAKNDTFYKLLRDVFQQIYLRYKPQYVGHQRPKEALKEHRAIIDAIAKHDLEEARKVIKIHIQYQMEHAAQFYKVSEFPHRI
ncbi:MAG: GntR family transcriptional regulator [Syntrophales bacterium]|jgi:DNA-binding GntR family transcriptional regulator|nr:GntR family transcriptional regulator [Syntrophales bacterium]